MGSTQKRHVPYDDDECQRPVDKLKQIPSSTPPKPHDPWSDACLLEIHEQDIEAVGKRIAAIRQNWKREKGSALINDPLPCYHRPYSLRNTDACPAKIYRYLVVLTACRPFHLPILPVWVDLWNTLGIRISFAVVCAIFEAIIEREPEVWAVDPDAMPLRKQVLARNTVKRHINQSIIDLYLWATSYDAYLVQRLIAAMLGEEFDDECSHEMMDALSKSGL